MKQKLYTIKSVPVGVKPYNIMYPCVETTDKKFKERALIVIRSPTPGDLEIQCSPSGPELDLLQGLLDAAGYKGSWLAMPFEHWKADRQDSSSKDRWFKHVKSVAAAFQADRILCLDLDPFVALVDPDVITKGY